jgi:outer membrane protein assembly factor BamA
MNNQHSADQKNRPDINKNRKCFYASFIIMFFFIFQAKPLYSQENTGIINSIEIIGLSRTKPHIAMQPLEKFRGMERTTFDENEIIAEIKVHSRTLEPISAELIEDEDNLILRVTVKEKWAIFPIPLINTGSSGYNVGLGILDTNAFGLGDMAALGGTYGTFGWSVLGMYNHPQKRTMLPGWNIRFMYGHQEKEAVDRDEKLHRRYSAEELRISLGLNYLFNDLITGSFFISFADQTLRDIDNAVNPPETGATVIAFSPGISLSQSSWDGFFTSEKSISLRYSYNYAISGSSYHHLELQGNYDQPLFPAFVPGFRLNIKSGGVWNSSTDPIFEEGPRRSQVNILPKYFSAIHYAGFSTGLEKHLYKFRWGTISVLGAWQGVFSYGPISDFEFNHGPAGGLNFYLSRLALPVIGGNIAYNMNSGLVQFNFNFGITL